MKNYGELMDGLIKLALLIVRRALTMLYVILVFIVMLIKRLLDRIKG